MPLVNLMLTPNQVRNLNGGRGIRLSANKTQTKGSEMSVEISDADYTKYVNNIKYGKGGNIKGTPVTDDEISEEEQMAGGSIFDDIGKAFKKTGRQIERGSKSAFKDVVRDSTKLANRTIRDGTKLANQAARDGKKIAYKTGRQLKTAANTYGVDAIEGFKRYVPADVAQEIASGAATAGVLGLTAMTGVPNPALAQMAGRAAGVGVDSVYDTNFRKRNALKQLGRNYVKSASDIGGAEMTQGGALNMKSISRGFNQSARQINRGGRRALKDVTKLANKTERAGKQIAKEFVSDAKQIGKQIGKQAIRDGTKLGYQLGDDIKKKIGKKGIREINLVYDDFNRAYNGLPLGALPENASYPLANIYHPEGERIVTKGGKLVKGSAEAKAFMASLRARRSKVGGKGMVPLGGRGMVPL